MAVAEVVQEDVHKVSEVNVVDLERIVLRAPRHERAVELGAVVVAHVIYKLAGLEPVCWSTDLIAFEDLELGLGL